MATETDADRLVFLDTDEFGESMTVGGVAKQGVFFNEYAEELDVESSSPAALFRTADVSSAAHGTVVVRGGVTYNVVGVQPDGTGMTLLILEDQS